LSGFAVFGKQRFCERNRSFVLFSAERTQFFRDNYML